MVDYQQLYEKTAQELQEIRDELSDYKETSKLIEQELESELANSTKRTKELERENQRLREEINQLKYDLTKLDQRLQGELTEKESCKAMKEELGRKKIELENENEGLNCQIRESGLIISDLENKMNETLEQLALVQTQLEMNQNQSQIQIERLKQQLRETEDELKISQLSPTRSPDKSGSLSLCNSPLKPPPLSPSQSKPYSHTVCNPVQDSPYFSLHAKPSSFMTLETRKTVNHTEIKERYKNLKKNPEFRLTCDEIKPVENQASPEKVGEKSTKHDKLKSKQHLEEKLKNFSANLSHLKSNNDGFHKSLDLVNGLIKGLDMKIQKIREMKEVTPKMLASQNLFDRTPLHDEDVVL